MLQTAKYIQLLSVFGTLLLAFLGLLALYDYQPLRLQLEKSKKSAYVLFASSVFYLLLLIGTSIYLSKQRVVFRNKRHYMKNVYDANVEEPREDQAHLLENY